MSADDHLETLTASWRDRHGPEVMRRRSTYLVEKVQIAFEDGSMAELTRRVDGGRYTITVDPDDRGPKVDLEALPAAVRKVLDR
jgi:hypothetical protein